METELIINGQTIIYLKHKLWNIGKVIGTHTIQNPAINK